MDDNEDPLGKISRQLSELATTPSTCTSLGVQSTADVCPESGGHWTQFSGIPTQQDQNVPFRNLYTWNFMDLPNNNPLPQPQEDSPLGNHLSGQPMTSHSTPPRGQREYLSHFDWSEESSSPSKFQVTSDLGGRFVDVKSSRINSGSFDTQSHIYERQGYLTKEPQVSSHNDRFTSDLVQPLSQGYCPQTSPFSSTLQRTRSEPSSGASRIASLLAYPRTHESFRTDDATLSRNGIQHSLHQGSMPSSPHLFSSQPVFDPSMPPPIFPVHRQLSESSVLTDSQPSHCHDSQSSHSQSQDFLDYLQLQGKESLNLDIGVNIDQGSSSYFSELDPDSVSSACNEGRSIYQSALNQWQSYKSKPGPPSDSSDITLVTAHNQEQTTEPQPLEVSKPSYSDIAKTPKTIGRTASSKMEQHNLDGSSQVTAKRLAVKKDGRAFRPRVKRTSSGCKLWPRISLGGGDADQARVSPNSKYGLDNFDDHVLCSGGHSSSSESLAQAVRSRRGSGSSAGSSVSAVDDISVGTSPQASCSEASTAHLHTPADGSSPNAAKCSPTSSKRQSAPVHSTSSDSLFFDPRRIFQPKTTNRSRAQSQQGHAMSGKAKGMASTRVDCAEAMPSTEDTILNNGKPTASNSSSKLSSNARQHDYINNDLRDNTKLTNQDAAENSQQNQRKGFKESRPGPGKRSSTRANNVQCRRERRKSPDMVRESRNKDSTDPQNHTGFMPGNWDLEKLEDCCSVCMEVLKVWAIVVYNSSLSMMAYLLGIMCFLVSRAAHLIMLLLGLGWTWVKLKLLKGWLGGKPGQGWPSSRDFTRRRVGLEECISLPSTGDEAMKRLLACKGKDPYSILGLRADSTDEDIKKYYRKQAVLVHPDKNQEPGAEEAFKILGHAFEMIGEPTKRKRYDSHTQEANEAEAMAANIMRCDNCDGKHRRVPMERPFYSARFCQQCNTHHSAKEGDVWAESTMLGFYWHYFALMEGRVFNITEWMRCHKEFFKHMKANTHGVLYRIATDGNKRNRHHQTGEANLEDFINRLFHKPTTTGAGDGQGTSWGGTPSAGDAGWTMGGAPPATSAGAKKGRRKKKRQ